MFYLIKQLNELRIQFAINRKKYILSKHPLVQLKKIKYATKINFN